MDSRHRGGLAVSGGIWADAIRGTIENLISENVRYQEPIGVVAVKAMTVAPGNDSKATKMNLCRAATAARNMRSPRWYIKHFDILVWGNRFQRRRVELAFLGGSVMGLSVASLGLLGVGVALLLLVSAGAGASELASGNDSLRDSADASATQENARPRAVTRSDKANPSRG